jgi:hypothetical protein
MYVKLFEEWDESRKWESPEYWKKGQDFWNKVLPKRGLSRTLFNKIIQEKRGASYREWEVLDRARRGDTSRYSTKS